MWPLPAAAARAFAACHHRVLDAQPLAIPAAAEVLTVPAEQRQFPVAGRLAGHAGRDRAGAFRVAQTGANPARPETDAQVLPAVTHCAVCMRVQVLEHLALEAARYAHPLGGAVREGESVQPQSPQTRG